MEDRLAHSGSGLVPGHPNIFILLALEYYYNKA